jgi:hypothetical protein
LASIVSPKSIAVASYTMADKRNDAGHDSVVEDVDHDRVDAISMGEKGTNSIMKPEPTEPEYSADEMNAVRKKIDWRIMPLAAWACGLQFVDKVHLPVKFDKQSG